jgi:hypothetical protein
MKTKHRASVQTKKRVKTSTTNQGSKPVADRAASAPRPSKERATSHRDDEARFPNQDEATHRSSDGREEQDYRDEVMRTRGRL